MCIRDSAHAEAKANEIIRLSVSPTVLQYRSLERWNGQLPVYTAGNGALPMLTIEASKLGGGMDEAGRQKRLKELLDESTTRGATQASPLATATPLAPPPAAPQAPAPAAPKAP